LGEPGHRFSIPLEQRKLSILIDSMVIFIDETTVELQNDLPEFDAFPIKLGT